MPRLLPSSHRPPKENNCFLSLCYNTKAFSTYTVLALTPNLLTLVLPEKGNQISFLHLHCIGLDTKPPDSRITRERKSLAFSTYTVLALTPNVLSLALPRKGNH